MKNKEIKPEFKSEHFDLNLEIPLFEPPIISEKIYKKFTIPEPNEQEKIEDESEWKFYVFLAICLLLTLLAVFVKLKF